MTGSTSMSLTLLPSAGLPGTMLGPSGPLSCFVLIWMIRAYSSCKSKFQYIKILEYFLRSIKERICKTEKFKFFKVCSFMHSILGRGSFSTNSSISEVWHGSDQSVALLRHY